MLSALLFCNSCVVDYGSDNGMSGEKLYSYGMSFFGENVVTPCTMLAQLIRLDAFIKASPEERSLPQFSTLRVHNLDDTTYWMEDTYYNVYTYGKDLYEEGCPWRIRVNAESSLEEIGYVYEGDNNWVTVPDGVRISFKGWDSTGESRMEIHPSVSEQSGERGLTSRFTALGDGAFHVNGVENMKDYYSAYGYYDELLVTGSYRVDIYRDGEPLDWVVVECYGKRRQIKTSRD